MAQTLLSSGYSPDNVKALLGGILSWENLGYPMTTGETPGGGSGGAAPAAVPAAPTP